MKKTLQLIVLAVVSAAMTFTSCKKEDQDLNTSSTTSNGAADFSENGANPNETVNSVFFQEALDPFVHLLITQP